jgi:hypothetical protein
MNNVSVFLNDILSKCDINTMIKVFNQYPSRWTETDLIRIEHEGGL